MSAPVVRAVDTPLASDRLILRALETSDCADIAALANNLDVARWLARLPHPYALSDAAYFVEEIAENAPVWGIRRKRDDAFVGVIGVECETADAEPELGYWLGEPYWGLGYATEAAVAVLDFSFGAAAHRRVVSGYYVGNARSAAVLRKLGFVETGRTAVPDHPIGGDRLRIDMALDAATWERRRRHG